MRIDSVQNFLNLLVLDQAGQDRTSEGLSFKSQAYPPFTKACYISREAFLYILILLTLYRSLALLLKHRDMINEDTCHQLF